MIVKVSELPKEIQQKLPLSLRIKDTIDTDYLNVNLKYEIENYLKSALSNIDLKDTNKEIYDIIFDKGKYDIKHITDIKELVITYIKNYLLTKKGSYPFDPEFGTNLYNYIQTKDLPFIATIISQELSQLIKDISNMLSDKNVSISITSLKIIPTSSSFESSYEIYMEVKINNSLVNMSVNIS